MKIGGVFEPRAGRPEVRPCVCGRFPDTSTTARRYIRERTNNGQILVDLAMDILEGKKIPTPPLREDDHGRLGRGRVILGRPRRVVKPAPSEPNAHATASSTRREMRSFSGMSSSRLRRHRLHRRAPARPG